VKGFTQIEGIDYEGTFSPAVKFTSIHSLLAMVAHLDLELFQMDIKIAFINGNLEEEIYVIKPLVLYQRDKKTRCVILKGLYTVISNLLDHGT